MNKKPRCRCGASDEYGQPFLSCRKNWPPSPMTLDTWVDWLPPCSFLVFQNNGFQLRDVFESMLSRRGCMFIQFAAVIGVRDRKFLCFPPGTTPAWDLKGVQVPNKMPTKRGSTSACVHQPTLSDNGGGSPEPATRAVQRSGKFSL